MLEIYPQENMNTQAIRELTDEVFNLKQKANNLEASLASIVGSIGNIETQIEAIGDYVFVQSITTFNSDLTLAAGAISSRITINNTVVPAGYDLIAMIYKYSVAGEPDYAVQAGVIPYYLTTTSDNGARAELINCSSSEKTIRSIVTVLICKKHVSA